jgi:hypothetical protein
LGITGQGFLSTFSRKSRGLQSDINKKGDVKGDLIKVMKAIKQHSLHDQDGKYEMAILCHALRTMISLRQRENESLQEYTKRFKTLQEVMELHLGEYIELPKYVAQMMRQKQRT